MFDGTRAPSSGHKGFSIVLKLCQFLLLFIYFVKSAVFNDFWPQKRQKITEALFILILREFFLFRSLKIIQFFSSNQKDCLFSAFWRVFPSNSLFNLTIFLDKSKVCLFSMFWRVFPINFNFPPQIKRFFIVCTFFQVLSV